MLNTIEYTKERPLRVFESFAGYGSQSMALQRLKDNYPTFDFKVVGFSEIDENAIKAYKAVHGDIKNYGDISKVNWDDVPDFDLFTASSPCQDISSSGKQAGLEEGSGTRSSLLWECKRAILAKKPRYVFFENVRVFMISILRTDSEPNPSFYFPKKMKLERRIKDILEPNVDESFYLSDKALEYFCRVNNDKSHGHNFTPKDGEDVATQFKWS